MKTGNEIDKRQQIELVGLLVNTVVYLKFIIQSFYIPQSKKGDRRKKLLYCDTKNKQKNFLHTSPTMR